MTNIYVKSGTEWKAVLSEGYVVSPIGTISAYAASTAPAGWLICDGQAVSRTIYSDLFALIGTTYGAGNGTTTFNVPNLKGRVPVGLDSSQTEFNALNVSGGSKVGVASHRHTTSHGHAMSGAVSSGNADHQHALNHSHSASASTTSTGGHNHSIRLSDQNIAGISSNYVRQGYNATGRTDLINYGDGGHNHNISVSIGDQNGNSQGASNAAAHSHGNTFSVTNFSGQSELTGTDSGNLQPYLTLNYIIKAAA